MTYHIDKWFRIIITITITITIDIANSTVLPMQHSTIEVRNHNNNIMPLYSNNRSLRNFFRLHNVSNLAFGPFTFSRIKSAAALHTEEPFNQRGQG